MEKQSINRGKPLHRWDLDTKEAIQIQNLLRSQVVFAPIHLGKIRLIAGVDVGLPRTSSATKTKVTRAAIAVLDFNTMDLVDHTSAEIPIPFPYVPGLLSFREMPAILAAIEQLKTQPDVFLVDGHGLAHPRRFGLACHLGVWLDKPAIGCGKSILVGEHTTLENSRGNIAYLMDRDETIGAAVRTRDHVKPVYISIGHRTDLNSSISVTLQCGRGVRLPEPIRMAHRLASS